MVAEARGKAPDTPRDTAPCVSGTHGYRPRAGVPQLFLAPGEVLFHQVDRTCLPTWPRRPLYGQSSFKENRGDILQPKGKQRDERVGSKTRLSQEHVQDPRPGTFGQADTAGED